MCASQLTSLAVVAALCTALAPAQGETTLRFKNGDAIAGQLLSGDGKRLRWSSPQFVDDLVVGTGELAAIEFTPAKGSNPAPFRIVTTSGDVWYANLVVADQQGFVFESARHGRVRLEKAAIHSIDRRVQPGLALDGSQFDVFRLVQEGPIRNLRYRAFQGEWGQDRLPDFDRLRPVADGRFTSGRFDLELAPVRPSYGLVFEGQLEIGEPGRFEFLLRGDDIVRLRIDGKLVAHSHLENVRARVDLTAGRHEVRLDYVDFGGRAILNCSMTGPGIEGRVELAGINRSTGWRRGVGGQAFTDKKLVSLFSAVELPVRFELDLLLSSSQIPQFCLGLGARVAGAVASEQPVRLETWGDGLMLVAGEVFEPIAKLAKGGRELRLRLVFDTKKGVVEVFDSSGSGRRVPGVQLTAGVSGVYLHNRGADLLVQRLRIGRIAAGSDRELSGIQGEHVRLVDGRILPGTLRVDAGGARVVRNGGADTVIELVQLASIERPAARLAPAVQLADDSVELRYLDGATVRGQLAAHGAEHISIHTAFAKAPLTCLLTGAKRLRFGAASAIQDREVSATDDEAILSAGRLRGRLSFSASDAALRFTPPSGSALRLASTADVRVEISRSRVSRGSSFDATAFPHVLHLKNGEVLPCWVEAFDRKVVHIRSPFGPIRKVGAQYLKAIEFSGTALGPRDQEPPFQREALERALTVPRFRRDDPPSHLVVALNGDMKRGVVLGISNDTISFESKLKKRNLPRSRIAWIVFVAAPASEKATEEFAKPTEGMVRVELDDGPVILCTPRGTKDGKLLGSSAWHGEVAVPIASIRNLELGDRVLLPRLLYDSWTVRPAPEPKYGK